MSSAYGERDWAECHSGLLCCFTCFVAWYLCRAYRFGHTFDLVSGLVSCSQTLSGQSLDEAWSSSWQTGSGWSWTFAEPWNPTLNSYCWSGQVHARYSSVLYKVSTVGVLHMCLRGYGINYIMCQRESREDLEQIKICEQPGLGLYETIMLSYK